MKIKPLKLLKSVKIICYLPFALFIIITFNSLTSFAKNDRNFLGMSVQEKDTLVSEFYQFLELETDMGWFRQYSTIEYENPIANFKVRIIWLPTNEPAPLNHVSGPGIIEFTDPVKNTRFTIQRRDLVYALKKVGLDSLDQRWNLLDKTIKLNFEDPKIIDRISLGSINEPFFFYDVDFDKSKELLITEVACGQQLSNTYKVYKLNNLILASDVNQLTNLKPFSLINDFTEFNIKEELILIEHYMGGGNMETSIYKKLDTNEFKLISIIKYTWEEKITLELVDGEMVIVKRENIKH